jgi:hypothetical protein
LILTLIAPGSEVGAAFCLLVVAAETSHPACAFAAVVPGVCGIALSAAAAGGLLGDGRPGGAAWTVEITFAAIAVVVVRSALEAPAQGLGLGFIEAVVGGVPATVEATGRASSRHRLVVEIGRASCLLCGNAP